MREGRGGKREKRRAKRKVGLICHVDAMLALNGHFNTV